MEDGAGLEPATYAANPGSVLAGAVMMRKLEHNNDEKYDDEEEDEAVLCS